MKRAEEGKEKSFLKALPSISYRASETTSFRSKRQTESNLEHPPNTLPPFSSPTLSSSFYTSSLGSSPSSSFINSLSSSSFVSSGTSPNRSYRDNITARKSNINSTLTVILIIAAWTRKSWLLKTWMAITSICAFSDLRSVLFDLMVRTNKQLHTLRFQMKIFLDPICTFSPYYLYCDISWRHIMVPSGFLPEAKPTGLVAVMCVCVCVCCTQHFGGMKEEVPRN